jgi:hypothetical protein
MSNHDHYEVLAKIADAYNPALLFISIVIALYFLAFKKDLHGLRLIVSAVIVYAIMFLDKKFSIWPAFGLDYSTHTATSLAMCLFICTAYKKTIVLIFLMLSLLMYAGTMVLLNYHSWSDIASTAFVIIVCLIPLYFKKMCKPKYHHNELIFADDVK